MTSAAADPLDLFNVCDLDGSGYIDKNELSRICTDLTPEQLTAVFDSLDSDGDGKISVSEFNEGFREMSGALLDISRCKRKERSQSVSVCGENDDAHEYIGSLDESLASLSCQEHICEMYQNLYDSDNPAIVQQFESIILGVVKDIQSYKMENERLVNSFQREKEHHEQHLNQLELEMETQVKNVEDSIRDELKNETNTDHDLIRSNMEEEIMELKDNLKRLQQLETMFDKDRINVKQYDKMRDRADEMISENRMLKNELSQAKTSLALVKSELVGLKQQYEDKANELKVEKNAVTDYILEQDNLTRQLHLLHDANRRLHDKNDDLLSALEYTRSGRSSSEILDDPQSRKISSASTLGDEIAGLTPPLLCIPPKLVTYPGDEIEVESMVEDMDSGMSTLRDFNEGDNDADSINKTLMMATTKRHRRRRQRRKRHEYNSDTELADEDSDDDLDFRDSRSDRTDYVMKSYSRPGSTGSGRSMKSLERMDSRTSTGSVRRKLPAPPHKVNLSEPERMYKIVLAGDAAVGKSSFIMRLCKDKFVPNLSSTLGVDFQTKVIDVDGRPIALQLWDTAGQERFRSIAKSYFRRADGVLLLYDCTYERSFINVRDWVQAVEDGSQKKVPIMFCANKTDMRDDIKSEGRRVVSFEDGQRLSREFNSLFIETSAKDGSNICEAVAELGRLLRTNEDIEVKTVGLQLQELHNTKKSTCCG